MNDSSTKHTFYLLAIALGLLGIASAVPWSDITGNRIKDFHLLADLVPNPAQVVASASMVVDPELEELMQSVSPDDGGAGTPSDEPAAAAATDSTATDTVAWIAPLTEAPRVDGHVVIESYTGSAPLARFREAIAQSGQRLVRVAVVGDSFIEGDIFTQDLRAMLQERYGGCGVGYVNLHSEMPGFRKSIRQSGSGWTMHNILNIGRRDTVRILAGEYADASADARSDYRGTSQSATTGAWDRSALAVLASDSCTVELINDCGSRSFELAPSPVPQLIELPGHTTHFGVRTGSPSLRALGVYMDGETGISVDCMSSRGSSGLNLRSLNRAMSRTVDYDLVILEFGINALSAEQTEYYAYMHGMIAAVERVKSVFPDADILVMGIADRGAKNGTTVKSLPTCNAMTDAQRKVAQRTGTHFYDTRAAQGGENAVVDWRERHLVNADYIHLNHTGGRVMAEEFMEGLTRSLELSAP